MSFGLRGGNAEPAEDRIAGLIHDLDRLAETEFNVAPLLRHARFIHDRIGMVVGASAVRVHDAQVARGCFLGECESRAGWMPGEMWGRKGRWEWRRALWRQPLHTVAQELVTFDGWGGEGDPPAPGEIYTGGVSVDLVRDASALAESGLVEWDTAWPWRRDAPLLGTISVMSGRTHADLGGYRLMLMQPYGAYRWRPTVAASGKGRKLGDKPRRGVCTDARLAAVAASAHGPRGGFQ